MTGPVSVRLDGAVAFVAIDNPPVNGLSRAIRAGLYDAFTALRGNADIKGVVLHGNERCFSAGGDIREFDTPAGSADPGLSKHVHPAIEACGKTVVAAIRGYALGGGLETAMACHYRVATPDARLGLPEAKIGVIPLSGTQRLPRLIGAEAAIDMILNGREVRATSAPRGLVDAVVEVDALIDHCATLALGPVPALVRDRPYPMDSGPAFSAARAAINAGAYSAFATHLLDAMQAGTNTPFDQGMQAARVIYDVVVGSPDSQAARAAFLNRTPQSKGQA